MNGHVMTVAGDGCGCGGVASALACGLTLAPWPGLTRLSEASAR